MDVDGNFVLAQILLELQNLNKIVDRLVYERYLVQCPACGSTNVVVLGTTNKRVKFFCKACAHKFQKSKDKLERDVPTVDEVASGADEVVGEEIYEF